MLKKYLFRPYDPKYKILFRKEKAKLGTILPKDARVEHTGSTAVPGLGGKGILDLIISVKREDLQRTKGRLEKNGYEFRVKGGDNERMFFHKDYMHAGRVRRVHVHLTHHVSRTWREHIAFRNYLRKNPDKAREYEKIKKQAVKLCKGEGETYRKHKNNFVNNLTRKALKEF